MGGGAASGTGFGLNGERAALWACCVEGSKPKCRSLTTRHHTTQLHDTPSRHTITRHTHKHSRASSGATVVAVVAVPAVWARAAKIVPSMFGAVPLHSTTRPHSTRRHPGPGHRNTYTHTHLGPVHCQREGPERRAASVVAVQYLQQRR